MKVIKGSSAITAPRPPRPSALSSQTVSAQRHLAETEVPAGAKASVFGGVSCAAEEEGLPLEAALPTKY